MYDQIHTSLSHFYSRKITEWLLKPKQGGQPARHGSNSIRCQGSLTKRFRGQRWRYIPVVPKVSGTFDCCIFSSQHIWPTRNRHHFDCLNLKFFSAAYMNRYHFFSRCIQPLSTPPPILGRTQNESSSRLLHRSCACLRRDAAGGRSNHSLELRQNRWVVPADHLFDVTPQKEIWGCQVGGLWRPAEGGAHWNHPTAHTPCEPFQCLLGDVCRCSILMEPF